MVETAMLARKNRPLLMVDLAVPRDIEPEVSQVRNTYLYNMDDLQRMVVENKQCRQQAAEEANKLIVLQADHLHQELQALHVNDAIKTFRGQVERICQLELQKAKKRLARGEDQDKVLADCVRLISNKIIHKPTVLMKQAAYDGHESILMLMKLLLGVEETTY